MSLTYEKWYNIIMINKPRLNIEEQLKIILEMRFPGQIPKKSQIKEVRRELIKRKNRSKYVDSTKIMSVKEIDTRRGDYTDTQRLLDSTPSLTPGRSKNKEWARTQEYLDKLEKQSRERLESNKPLSTKQIDKMTWEVFSKRHPGQLPKKGQIIEIRKEIKESKKLNLPTDK